DAMMARLVDSYECEWAAVVRDPEKRKAFRQFVNTEDTESCIEIVHERGQARPADWPSEFVSLEQFRMLDGRTLGEHEQEQAEGLRWVAVGCVSDFPRDGGATVKYGQSQLAVFNLASRRAWYAAQNMCPHRKAFVLSRGILGDAAGEPKVACPLHKKTFSLDSGQSLEGEEYQIRTFPVRVVDEEVQLHLPPEEVLDRWLGTEIGCRLATACSLPFAPPTESPALCEALST
ncbi:MAG TPA: nitrite reductase small subunit NirD, partial [Lacipirellula sp.]